MRRKTPPDYHVLVRRAQETMRLPVKSLFVELKSRPGSAPMPFTARTRLRTQEQEYLQPPRSRKWSAKLPHLPCPTTDDSAGGCPTADLSQACICLPGKLEEVEMSNLKEPLWQGCPAKPASFPHSTSLKLSLLPLSMFGHSCCWEAVPLSLLQVLLGTSQLGPEPPWLLSPPLA